MTDLPYLVEHAIPEGRQSLESGYTNLERIAAYCEANYIQVSRSMSIYLLYFRQVSEDCCLYIFQSTDKRAALEETKRLTVQSLASVAFQINSLASNIITMLDLQMNRVVDMETQLNNISQVGSHTFDTYTFYTRLLA